MRRLPALALILFVSGCLFDKEPEVIKLSGETMGTTFNIFLPLSNKSIENQIDDQSIHPGFGLRNVQTLGAYASPNQMNSPLGS